MARAKGNKVRKATRRAVYGTARAVLPQGMRRRVRAAIGPSKAEERKAAEKAQRHALKQQQTQEKRERKKRVAPKAKSSKPKAGGAKADSRSGVGPR